MTQSILIYYSSTIETRYFGGLSILAHRRRCRLETEHWLHYYYESLSELSSLVSNTDRVREKSRQAHFPIVAGQATCVLFRPNLTPCATADRRQAKNS